MVNAFRDHIKWLALVAPTRLRLLGGTYAIAWLMLSSVAGAQALPERCNETWPSRLLSLFERRAPREPILLRVAGVGYAIPQVYFRYPPYECAAERQGFLLRVLLPTFEGWSGESATDLEGKSDWMNILLHVIPPDPEMLRVFGAAARGADPHGHFPLWDGLLHTTNQYGDDVFFERSEHAVVFIMVCRTSGQVRFPTCSQYFHYREALAKLSFSRTHLPEWWSLRRRAEDLLGSFAAASTEAD